MDVESTQIVYKHPKYDSKLSHFYFSRLDGVYIASNENIDIGGESSRWGMHRTLCR